MSQKLAYSKTEGLIGGDAGIEALFEEIRGIARIGDTAIMIQGETGVGKEGCARAIHYNSPRKDKPLVTVNCASIPDSLAESAWFGHRKGAFTGATTDRPGYFEAAHGGVLFLDEVGDLSLESQALLLRALQEKEIVRVGEIKERRIDVRIVSATNKDLLAMIECGEFRRDLYHRLVGEPPVIIPSLRDRPESIAVLIQHFIEQFSRQYKVHLDLPDNLLAALRTFSWPGNVRQLKATIKHLLLTVARNGGRQIRLEDLPEDIRNSQVPQVPTPYKSNVLRDAILRVLGQMGILSVSDLVKQIGRNRHAISYQLEQMESEGLIRIERRRGRGGNIVNLSRVV